MNVMLWNELVLGAVMSQSNCKDTSQSGRNGEVWRVKQSACE